jgi:O-antigen/teichoic acid export membrane protein
VSVVSANCSVFWYSPAGPEAMSEQLYRRFLRDNVVVGIANLSSQALNLLLIPLVIKTSGPATYGAFSVVTSLLALVMVLASLGIGYGYRRYLPVTDGMEERADIFYAGVAGQTGGVLVGAFIVGLAFPAITGALFKEQIALAWWWVPAFLLSGLYFNQAGEYFRYTHRMPAYCGAAFVGNLLYLALVLAIAAVGVSVQLSSLLGTQTAVNCIVGSFLWYRILREAPLSLRRLRPAHLWSDMKLGLPVAIAGVYEQINGMSDRYVLAIWLSVAAVGLYAPAAALGSFILILPRIISVVLPQILSVAVDHSAATRETLVRYSIRFLYLLGVPVIFGSAVVSDPALRVLANADVATAGRHVVPIIAAASVVYGTGWILNAVLFVDRRTPVSLVASIVSGCAKIALAIVALTLHFGLTGVAVAGLIGQVAGVSILARHCGLPLELIIQPWLTLRAALSGAIMFVILLFARMHFPDGKGALLELTTLILAGVAIYGACLTMMRVFSGKELGFLRRSAASAFGR